MLFEGSEVKSGNIKLGLDPDRVLKALGSPARRSQCTPATHREVSRQLVRCGFLAGDPVPVLVAEMVEGLEAEERSLRADEVSYKGNAPVSEETEHLWNAVERSLDSPQVGSRPCAGR